MFAGIMEIYVNIIQTKWTNNINVKCLEESKAQHFLGMIPAPRSLRP